jgi:hypothetical protein
MVYLSKTQDCQFIEIKSDTISDFILNPTDYTSFTITGKLNCCGDEEITETITGLEIGSNVFTLQFPVAPTTIIDSIVFENIFTHQQFTLPIGSAEVADYMCSTGDITLLFPIIDAWFVTNFGGSVTQGYTYDAITNTCVYTITDLPENITPVNMVTYVVGNQQDIYFGYFPIEGMFFNSNVMYISPSFFNMTEFVDGIYSFSFTFVNKSNNIITESNCFFFDCQTKCKVSTQLEELLECNKRATNIFLLHYTLTEGSNCGCNCDELCAIFNKLCSELGTNQTCVTCGC